jgi:hypothetical protein
VWNPSAESADAVSVAWLYAPVPFITDTVTDEGAGSGVPVIESMVGPMPSTWSTAFWSCGCAGNSTSP